ATAPASSFNGYARALGLVAQRSDITGKGASITMNPRVLAWVASAVFLPLLGAGPAFATDSPSGTQAISQCACSQQSADASAASTQTKPTNQNISVNVLSPGDTGPVTQTNSSAAVAAAGNNNSTDQTASQDPPSGGSTQAIG